MSLTMPAIGLEKTNRLEHRPDAQREVARFAKTWRGFFMLLIVLFLAGHVSVFAQAPPCFTADYHTGGWRTEDYIGGTAPPGSTVTITWKSFQGDTYTLSTTATAKGTWQIRIPDGGTYGSVTVTATGCPGNIVIKSPAALAPGDNTAVTVLAVAPGSTASFSGATFNLSGAITLFGTDVDYSTNSPTYGNLSGYISASALNLSGTGPAGTLIFSLATNQPWTVSMLSSWMATNAADDSISFSVPVSGMASLQTGAKVGPTNISSAFSGAASGTVFFSETNEFEQMSLMLNFNSSFGTITGNINASGSSYITYNMSVGLGVSNTIVVSWNSDATNTSYLLQQATSLSPPNWAAITNPPVLTSNQLQMTIPLTGNGQFLRLVEPAAIATQ